MVLKERIKESGLTVTYISKQLKITRAAFYNKMNGKSSFTVFEILKLSKLLNVPLQVLTEETINERY